MVHRFKAGSIVAVCIGDFRAGGEVKSQVYKHNYDTDMGCVSRKCLGGFSKYKKNSPKLPNETHPGLSLLMVTFGVNGLFVLIYISDMLLSPTYLTQHGNSTSPFKRRRMYVLPGE